MKRCIRYAQSCIGVGHAGDFQIHFSAYDGKGKGLDSPFFRFDYKMNILAVATSWTLCPVNSTLYGPVCFTPG